MGRHSWRNITQTRRSRRDVCDKCGSYRCQSLFDENRNFWKSEYLTKNSDSWTKNAPDCGANNLPLKQKSLFTEQGPFGEIEH